MEAKYVVACEAAKESVWLKKVSSRSWCHENRVVSHHFFLFLFFVPIVEPLQNPMNHRKEKHIEHNNREIVSQGDVVAKIPSAENLTNLFTKTLPQKIFKAHLKGM
jgi:hypothetical protein